MYGDLKIWARNQRECFFTPHSDMGGVMSVYLYPENRGNNRSMTTVSEELM